MIKIADQHQGFLYYISIIISFFLASLLIAYHNVFFENFLLSSQGTISRILLIFLNILLGAAFYYLSQEYTIRNRFIGFVATANLLFFANLLGTALIQPLKRASEIVLLCIIASWADLLSYIQGPTKLIADSIKKYYESDMTKPPPIGDYLLLKTQIIGTEHLLPLVGVSDWIVVSFLSAAAIKFKINDNIFEIELSEMVQQRRLYLYCSVASFGLLVSLVTANLFSKAIPALPFMTLIYVGFLLWRKPEARNFSRKEVSQTAIIIVIMTLLIYGSRFV